MYGIKEYPKMKACQLRNIFILLIFVVQLLCSCGGAQPQDPKIKFDLSEFTDEGLRERPKGEFSAISYEFCIPADEKILQEVQAIDSTAGVLKGSKGRSGCSDKEWLCIGNSHQAGFKKVITKLAGLSYIRKITETFWE